MNATLNKVRKDTERSAAEHEMCAVCWRIRRERYEQCTGTCKARTAYDICESKKTVMKAQ